MHIDFKEGLLKMLNVKHLESPYINDDTEHGENDMISVLVQQGEMCKINNLIYVI